MCNLQFAWFLGTLYNTTKAIIAALINGDVKYALVEKSELEFYVKYMQSEKEVHLGIVDLYENKNDVACSSMGNWKNWVTVWNSLFWKTLIIWNLLLKIEER